MKIINSLPGLSFATILLLFSCTTKIIGPASEIKHPEWSKNAVIYEVNLRQYTPGGTFNEFADHLPRLKKMGIDILWLMPVNPIGEKNRKGSLGSYYSVQNYLKVNPEYGTMDEFKSLVVKAHENGMKVIIDWVANHTSWDNPLITEHPGWYKKDTAGNIISPVADWTDVAQLDFNNIELRDYMIKAMLFWISETDIDGFRCDVAGMVPNEFWNFAVPELKKQKDIFMLAEAESPKMHDTAFDMTYSWGLFHLMKSIYKGEKSADKIDSLLAKEALEYPQNAYRMRFTSNHDENTWAGTEYELFGDAARSFSALTFLVPGMPLIYSGQEAGLNKRLRFFDKDTISWSNFEQEKFYTDLIRLKEEQPALYNGAAGGTYSTIKNDHHQKVLTFIRKQYESKVIGIFNLSAERVTVNMMSEELRGNWEEFGNGMEYPPNIFSKLDLLPWEVKIFIK